MSSERYEIIDKIGQGGVGAVYKALDTQLNREVAMKRVLADDESDSAEATKNLLKEAASLSALQHPHIVTVYDSGIDEDGPYVVMELIKGRTLDEMVERGTLTWDDLYEVALQTQEALIAAQDLNLVHRDLKPSNLMVCWLASGRFQVKIVDFGLAKFSATPSLQTIDHGDAVFGSIFFMAPEQFERTPLDQRTDMYAMGALYYYALTGEYPFNGDTAAAVMASHLQHHVTHLSEVRPDIPTWAANWIMWHMERNMDDRPVNARTALEQLLILKNTDGAEQNFNTSPAQGGTEKATFNFGEHPQHIAAMQPTQGFAQSGTTSAVQITAPGTNATNPHTQAQQTLNQIHTNAITQQVHASTNAITGLQTAQVTTAPQIVTAEEGKSSFLSKINDLPIIAKVSAVLALGLLAFLLVSLNQNEAKKEAKAYDVAITKALSLKKQNKLQEGLTLTEAELNALLNRAASSEGNPQQQLLRQGLAFAQGSDFEADPVIAQFITTSPIINKSTRADLIDLVMANRNNPSNIEPLLQFASITDNTNSAVAAINAAKANLDPENADKHVKFFTKVVTSAKDTIVINSAKTVINEITGKTAKDSSSNQPVKSNKRRSRGPKAKPKAKPQTKPETDEAIYTPDPNKAYYLDNVRSGRRLISTGSSETASTQKNKTANYASKWKFVANDNGYWHLQLVNPKGSAARLCSKANHNNPQQAIHESGMTEVSVSDESTYFKITSSSSFPGAYYLTLPDVPAAFGRLFIDRIHKVKITSSTITEDKAAFYIKEAN